MGYFLGLREKVGFLKGKKIESILFVGQGLFIFKRIVGKE